MAYLYLNDGGPEADEYESNYLYFDGADAQTVERLQNILCCNDTNNPDVRSQLLQICDASLNKTAVRTLTRPKINWVKNVSKMLNMFL
ncbi:hypothetical protein JW960_17680 [candidate division KSB1 bacterium]|nr:hypothetical protein [candidate division KSB1 bacterium]